MRKPEFDASERSWLWGRLFSLAARWSACSFNFSAGESRPSRKPSCRKDISGATGEKPGKARVSDLQG